MGDNIWLGDRDGVRTPMQWTPDRNGGFSTRRPAADVPAAEPGPGLRLPGDQRRVAAAQHQLAAAVGPPDDPGPRPAPDVRPGHVRGDRLAQPDGAVVRPPVRRRHRAVRQQPVPVPAAGGAGPAPVRGLHARRADRPGRVPADRRPARTCSPWPGTASTGSSCPSPPSRSPTSTRTGRAPPPVSSLLTQPHSSPPPPRLGEHRQQLGRRLPARRRGGQRRGGDPRRQPPATPTTPSGGPR